MCVHYSEKKSCKVLPTFQRVRHRSAERYTARFIYGPYISTTEQSPNNNNKNYYMHYVKKKP